MKTAILKQVLLKTLLVSLITVFTLMLIGITKTIKTIYEEKTYKVSGVSRINLIK